MSTRAADAAIGPIWRRARREARKIQKREGATERDLDRAQALLALATDLRILSTLPGRGPMLLGFCTRECVTGDDWLKAAAAVAKRKHFDLTFREQVPLDFSEAPT